MQKVDWHGLGQVLAQVQPGPLAAGSFLTFVLILLLAIRWRLFLRQQQIPDSFSDTLRLTWGGQFFNAVLPGSTGGDVVKIFQLCRKFPDRKAAAAVSVVIDRLTALIALAVLSVWAFLTGPTGRLAEVGLSFSNRLPWLAGVSLAFTLLLLFGARWVIRSDRWMHRFRTVLGTLRTSIRFDRTLALAVLLAFTIHFVSFAIFFLFARALAIEITFAQVLQVMPLVLALLLLPVTVNGHGLREVLLVFFFHQLGVTVEGIPNAGTAEIVVSLSILGVSNELLWSIPGGLWLLATRSKAIAPAA